MNGFGSSDRSSTFGATGCLALVVVAAKATLLALRRADGGAAGLDTPWAVFALLVQDSWLVLAFGALEGTVRTLLRWRQRAGATDVEPIARAASVGLWLAYASLVAWTAVNIPVARLFATPATLAFLYATGRALGDSASVYLTAANVLPPVGLVVLAAAAPRWRWPATVRPSRGTRAALRRGLIAVAIAVATLGPFAARRVPTVGLDRNAVVTLLSTAAAQLSGRTAMAGGDAGAAACAPTSGDAVDLRALRGAAAGRNVVWVILESTAARFLASYGAARDATPNLTALAAHGLLFDSAYAAYPESIKGLFSMLCARPPPAGQQAPALAAGRAPCAPLPRLLADAGYKSGLFHSGRFVYLGMNAVVRDRGFDRLEDGATIGGAFASSFGVDDASTARRALSFVDGLAANEPFFIVYMPIAGHHPYRAPGDGPRPFAERTETDAYANDLFVADASLGILRAGLGQRGLDDRTLYVIVGDHGEAFREHPGNIAHSLFLYEENLRVPFVIAAPGLWTAPRRAPQLASLTDVAPTILDLLGRPPAPGQSGQSLLAPTRRLARFFTDQGIAQRGLRDGPWKVIIEQDTGRAQLFELTVDPTERHDLSAAQPERVARYRACLDGD